MAIMPKILRQHNVITEARYDMSAMEKNIVYLLMAEIKEGDNPGKQYCISVSKLEKRIGKINKTELRKATRNLISRTYHIEKGGNILIVSLMGVVHYDAEEALLKVKISRNILPYFITVKKNFTEFELDMALSMRSKYSKRIYEMLSQHLEKGEWKVEVAELKKRLCLKKEKEEMYTGWSAFKNQVLEVAKKEITEQTNIIFTYSSIKTGKKYTHLHFKIIKKPEQLRLFGTHGQ